MFWRISNGGAKLETKTVQETKAAAGFGAPYIVRTLENGAGHAPILEGMKLPTPNTLTSPIDVWLRNLHEKYRNNMHGHLASYIPELTKADAKHFGIVLAAADGKSYATGDSEVLFTIQSISKPLVYGLALEDHGSEAVLKRVGVEPTGEAFNSIVMDELNNRPFNPMVNAGAIATTALIRGNGFEDRFKRILDMFSRYAGRQLTVDESVFASERATGHRNRAIAYLQLNSGMIEEPVSEHLDLYFRQCAILVSARDLAMMAATLANNGVNPVTHERAIAPEHVKTVLSVMASCGMYDYSGEWVYRVGLPAKSGVGGGIIAVLPGQFGVGTFSPLLDDHGNSHRGIEVCKELSQRFHLHVYDMHFVADNIVRRSYRGGGVTSKRLRGARERKALDSHGHQIIAYELQGGLYFATAEQLVRRIVEDSPQSKYVLLDGRRISRADQSALMLLRDLKLALAHESKVLVLAALPEQVQSDWLKLNSGAGLELCFGDVDAALEYCETKVILTADPGAMAADALLPLADMDILRGFSADEIGKLAPYIQTSSYDAGAFIIREGDAADRLYLLASGSASVDIVLDDAKSRVRLAAFRPGVAFGEFALFDGGRRVANVVAETAAVCYVLDFANLERLEATEPKLYRRVLFALGRLLTDRLRRVTAEVRALT
ncbi:MAG: glutaminase A [Hyphomicrobium sp.]|nr:glutaminase A [Hyphomicrobium sp.]